MPEVPMGTEAAVDVDELDGRPHDDRRSTRPNGGFLVVGEAGLLGGAGSAPTGLPTPFSQR
eukprot:10436774-Alexandrium_andersonii.AAC.1